MSGMLFILSPYHNTLSLFIPFGEKCGLGVFLALAYIRLILYLVCMTQAVAQILSEFEHLSDTERRELRRVIVERVPMSGELTDDDYGSLAAASFRALDEEEDARRA